MATRKNKLTTVFDGDDKPFQKKIKRVQNSVKKTTGMLKGMGMAIGTAGIVAGISRTIQHFDRLGKIATRLDMSAEALQRLGHAAELSGSNMAQLQGIMTRLERRTGEALQNTTGSQAQRFKELNIEVEEFSNLNPEDKILAIADAFNALGGTEQSVASLMGLLDTEVRELLPLLKQGSDGIQKMMGEISVLTDKEVKAMEAAADQIQRFKQWGTTTFGQALMGLSSIFEKPPEMQMGAGYWGKDIKGFSKMGHMESLEAIGPLMRAYGFNKRRTKEERELMLEYNTGDLRVARNKRKLRDQWEGPSGPPTPLTGPSMGLDFFDKGKGISKLGRMLVEKYDEPLAGSKALEQADFINALTGGKSYTPSVVGSKALETHDILQALMGGDTGAMAKATSSTSGRFGEFVAAATLGSGQGRMGSQRRGIRIEGIDTQTRILEQLKKHLDELAGNTTPK